MGVALQSPSDAKYKGPVAFRAALAAAAEAGVQDGLR
jgi:hypothetical protein